MKTFTLIILIISNNLFAQKKVVSYYANKTIAIEVNHDSIFFYNSLGNLTRLIDLKQKKSISYGLPIEVQNLIYYGDVNYENINDNTFQTYLYTKAVEPASEVICTTKVFYNELGLKKGYIEQCPNDSGSDDYVFGGENIYQYNLFGQLTTIKEKVVKKYDKNGNMISYLNRYKYYYTANKLTKRVRYNYQDTSVVVEVTKYEYGNNNELLTMTNYGVHDEREWFRLKYVFSYNAKGLILNIQEVTTFENKILLEYAYNKNSKIKHSYIYPNKSFSYDYNSNGYVIKITGNNDFLRLYEYNKNGRLVSITHKWGRSVQYSFFDFE